MKSQKSSAEIYGEETLTKFRLLIFVVTLKLIDIFKQYNILIKI